MGWWLWADDVLPLMVEGHRAFLTLSTAPLMSSTKLLMLKGTGRAATDPIRLTPTSPIARRCRNNTILQSDRQARKQKTQKQTQIMKGCSGTMSGNIE